jgi:hypothetical protein
MQSVSAWKGKASHSLWSVTAKKSFHSAAFVCWNASSGVPVPSEKDVCEWRSPR